MPRWQKVVATFLGSGVAGGLVYLYISGQMPPNVLTAVLTTSGVLLAAVMTHLIAKQRELEARQHAQRREIEARHFEQKRAAYDDLLGIYVDVLRQNIKALGSPQKKLNQQQIAARLFDLKRKVLLWGSRDMVVWWLELTEGADSQSSPTDPITNVDRLILLMREELGQDNSGIESGDLISMFLAGGRSELPKTLER